MKYCATFLCAALFLLGCNTKKNNKMAIAYPETAKVDSVDTYFGNEVADPYRWLEDDRAPETGRKDNALAWTIVSG